MCGVGVGVWEMGSSLYLDWWRSAFTFYSGRADRESVCVCVCVCVCMCVCVCVCICVCESVYIDGCGMCVCTVCVYMWCL